jgi:hypothetical protein
MRSAISKEFHYVLRRGSSYRQRLALARLALRVVRYRQQNGRLPERLLDPAEPALVAPLWFAGKPAVYERLPDGFSLAVPREAVFDDSDYSEWGRWVIRFRAAK